MENSRILNNPARIWTFDGGGPGVISQLIIVHEVMLQIQWMLKLTEVPRPYEYADLMVGSGLGAVVVILLARLRLAAMEAYDHLIKLGQHVFIENMSTRSHRFDVERLSKTIYDILRDHGLDEGTKMIEDVVADRQPFAALTAVPTSDLSTCRLLRTYPDHGTDSNCTILDAALATVALPEWFPPIMIGSGYLKEELMSGSIGFNNPTKKALDEAAQVFGSEHQVSIIISVGSGQQQTRSLTERTTEEVLGATLQEGNAVADDLAKRFPNSSFYYRFSIDCEANMTTSTAWSESSLGAIYSHTKTYMERVSSSIATVAKTLVEMNGSHTIGQLTQVQSKATMAKPLPRLSPHYIVREDLYGFMNQRLIHDRYNGQKLFVIYGMAGAGKTQLASFFAKKNLNRYDHVFFIDASSVDNIKADLQSAIRSLGGKHSQDTYEDALQFLARGDNREWLIIFDNVDDLNLPLTSYLPKCDHGTVIITGRYHGLARLAPTSHLGLEGMDKFHSIQVLFKAAQRNVTENERELESITELCKLLGGLPLALVQVGCYCHTAQISFLQYLERFKMHRVRLMETNSSPQLDEYSYSTYTSINLSYSLLDERACALLRLLAFFNHSNICLDIFQTAAKYEFTTDLGWEILPRDNQHDERPNNLRQLLIPDGSWSDIYIDDVLHKLQNYSLISLSRSNGQINITLHPLIQSCILDTLSSEDYSLYFYMAVCLLSSCSRFDEIHLFQYLYAHIAELESRDLDIHPKDMMRFAYILYGSGSYEETLKICRKVRDECRRVNGEEHISTVLMSYHIADCLRLLYKYDEAGAMMRRVAKTQELILGKDDEHTLDSYESLARILIRQRKTEEAENILNDLLALNQSKYGPGHWRTLSIQSSLADNLRIQRRYLEAEVLSRSVLPVMKRVLGEDDDITLFTLSRLSLALIEQEKCAEAEDISSDSMAKQTRKQGKQHPNTLTFLCCFGVCRFKRGDLDEADGILREVLGLQERILGKDHPDTILTRNWLEDVIKAQELLHSTGNRPPNPQHPYIPADRTSVPDDHSPPKRPRKSARLERIQEVAAHSSLKPTRRSTKSKGIQTSPR